MSEERRGYMVNGCGHRRPILSTGYIGSCACDRPAPRLVLRAVIELADDAPGLSDAQLRTRLAALADCAR